MRVTIQDHFCNWLIVDVDNPERKAIVVDEWDEERLAECVGLDSADAIAANIGVVLEWHPDMLDYWNYWEKDLPMHAGAGAGTRSTRFHWDKKVICFNVG